MLNAPTKTPSTSALFCCEFTHFLAYSLWTYSYSSDVPKMTNGTWMMKSVPGSPAIAGELEGQLYSFKIKRITQCLYDEEHQRMITSSIRSMRGTGDRKQIHCLQSRDGGGRLMLADQQHIVSECKVQVQVQV